MAGILPCSETTYHPHHTLLILLTGKRNHKMTLPPEFTMIEYNTGQIQKTDPAGYTLLSDNIIKQLKNQVLSYSTSLNFTVRPSFTDLRAAFAIRTGLRPSIAPTGTSVLFTIASKNCLFSSVNDSMYLSRKK